MNWFFIALGAPFLWALINIADNYLIGKFSDKEKERSSGGLVLFSSLIGIFIAFLIWLFADNVFNIPTFDKILLLTCGVLTITWIIFYLFALEIEETSAVVPWFLFVPVFGYILGYLFLGENLTIHQFIGSGIIFFGSIIISFDFRPDKRKFKKKHVYYMLLSCITLAISGVLFKYVTVENNFWVSSFWEYVGLGVSGLLIFIFVPHYRALFLNMNRTGGRTIFMVNIISELMSISGTLLTNFALLLAPVAMVYLVGNFQSAIVLILATLGTKFFPHIVKEDLSRHVFIPKVIAITFMIFGSIILFL